MQERKLGAGVLLPAVMARRRTLPQAVPVTAAPASRGGMARFSQRTSPTARSATLSPSAAVSGATPAAAEGAAADELPLSALDAYAMLADALNHTPVPPAGRALAAARPASARRALAASGQPLLSLHALGRGSARRRARRSPSQQSLRAAQLPPLEPRENSAERRLADAPTAPSPRDDILAQTWARGGGLVDVPLAAIRADALAEPDARLASVEDILSGATLRALDSRPGQTPARSLGGGLDEQLAEQEHQ